MRITAQALSKAYYSLDLDDGIENAVLYREPTPQEIYEQKLLTRSCTRPTEAYRKLRQGVSAPTSFTA
jgi:hypothetical protein